MQQKQLERFFTIVAIAILFFCSYRAFAPLNTPNLNADRAIHVLMAADLKLPQDLYYWGQNRLGSIVPLLSAGVADHIAALASGGSFPRTVWAIAGGLSVLC